MGICLVVKNNLRRGFRHRLRFIVTFLLPILLCSLFGLIRFDQVSLRVGILESQRETCPGFKEELTALLEQSEGISYGIANRESPHTDLRMGRFHVLLELQNAASAEEIQIVSVQSEERQQLLQEAFRRMLREKHALNLEGFKTPGLPVTERSLTMVLSIFMVLAILHASSFIHDRDSGIILRYRSAGYKQSQYLLGYLLYTLLLTFVQVLSCICSLLLLQQGFRLDAGEILFITVVIAAMSSSYAVVICALSRGEVSANITASSLVGIFAILGGTFVAAEAMPGLLQSLSLASPMRWLVELLRVIRHSGILS